MNYKIKSLFVQFIQPINISSTIQFWDLNNPPEQEWYNIPEQYQALVSDDKGIDLTALLTKLLVLPILRGTELVETDFYIYRDETRSMQHLRLRRGTWEGLEPNQQIIINAYCNGFLDGYETGWS